MHVKFSIRSTDNSLLDIFTTADGQSSCSLCRSSSAPSPVSLFLSPAQVGDAMRRMQERNNIGKIILTTEPMKEEEKKEEAKKDEEKKKDDKKKDDKKDDVKKEKKEKEEAKKDDKKADEKKEEAKKEEN